MDNLKYNNFKKTLIGKTGTVYFGQAILYMAQGLLCQGMKF